MLPNKMHWFLGYQSLGLILDQERKHWLLKTDKKKQLIDPQTGNTFQGQIDNLGSDIIIETEFSPSLYSEIASLKYVEEEDAHLSKIFENSGSTFPYCSEINGLGFARVVSVNYPTSVDVDDLSDEEWVLGTGTNPFKHYRLLFKNCETIILPFGGSHTTTEVFATKWIKTNDASVILLDDDGNPTTEIPIQFQDHDEVSFYYPLSSSLQTVPLESDGNGTYHTLGFNDDQYIGYPAFWFSIEDGFHPYVTCEGRSTNNRQLIVFGTPGTGSIYEGYGYVGVDGDCDATPRDEPTSDCSLIVQPITLNGFRNNASDFSTPIKPILEIAANDGTYSVRYPIQHQGDDDDITMYMVNHDQWEYVDENTYQIPMNAFDTNCMTQGSNPLIPVIRFALNVDMDATSQTTTDIGRVGIRMNSGNEYSDMYHEYPYHLNKWSGLPDYMINMEDDHIQDHMAIYALHDTPSTVEESPETKQTAALLFDLGEPSKMQFDFEADVYCQDNQCYYHMGFKILTYPEDIMKIANSDIIDCFDEQNRMILKLFVPKVNYATRNWSGFSNSALSTTNRTGDVFPDDFDFETIDVFHITKVSGAETDGAGLDTLTGLTFDMYRIREKTDIGRIYVLSNDDIEYANNRTTPLPKPERTVARICDIPTSIVQLTGISNAAPIAVVDPHYVRSEVSFTLDDKDRLYNKLGSRWVRPTAARKEGKSATSDNDYVFSSITDLNNVDLLNGSTFRYINRESLDIKIDPTLVTAGSNVNPGTGYEAGDYGLIYVGGFAFQYNVQSVVSNGNVSKFEITAVKTGDPNDKVYPPISLSNFDLEEGTTITKTYGTSPVTGNGKGFKCTMVVPSVDENVILGEIYDDLFAFVKQSDGIYIFHYEVDMTGLNGEWKKQTKVSDFEAPPEDSIYQSTTDAFMASVVPVRRGLSCTQYHDHEELLDVECFSTPSFINIIDTGKTPIQTDVTIDDTTSDVQEMDLCKYRCDGISSYTATEKTWTNALNILKAANKVYADCYIAFKWEDENDPENLQFMAGIIYRGFINLLSTEESSILPENELEYPNRFHSNGSTTIVWNVPKVGPMMWIFNPVYKVHEKYHIDKERQTFYIERTNMDWDDIDFGIEEQSLFKNDVLQYDIYTNSPFAETASEHTGSDHIYDQPHVFQILSKGTKKNQIDQTMIGNWECVFPRVHGFIFQKDGTRTRHVPLQMQMIHANYVSGSSRIINEETGEDESSRTLILEDTTSGTRLRVFNGETTTWDIL